MVKPKTLEYSRSSLSTCYKPLSKFRRDLWNSLAYYSCNKSASVRISVPSVCMLHNNEKKT